MRLEVSQLYGSISGLNNYIQDARGVISGLDFVDDNKLIQEILDVACDKCEDLDEQVNKIYNEEQTSESGMVLSMINILRCQIQMLKRDPRKEFIPSVCGHYYSDFLRRIMY